MKVGVHVANGRPWASADSIVDMGLRAEELGFDSVWVSDQVVVPSRVDSRNPYAPTGQYDVEGNQNIFEAITVLTYLAGKTSRVKLGTSVLELSYRQPLVVAKQWSTLDALTGGRTVFGVGAGMMREQYVALGVGELFDRRGVATDEALRLFRLVWRQQGDITFDGPIYPFGPIRFLPKPAQPGGPPIWVGGHSRRAIRRAAELGDGWHIVDMSLDDLRAGVATLTEFLDRAGRQRADVTVSAKFRLYRTGTGTEAVPRASDLVGSAGAVAEKISAYRAVGLEYLVIDLTTNQTQVEAMDALEFFAQDVLPLVS
jgi:probable F420-dependent oxidoreductase